MSWKDDISQKLSITTGDGKTYSPLWLNASKAQEFNISEFDFPNIAGTLVDRRQPRGTKYNMELYFQGDDFQTELEAFETSSKDPRPWVMSHPLYGQRTVQPLSLEFDLTSYNTAQVKGTVMETIATAAPRSVTVPKDRIAADKVALNDAYALSFKSSGEPSLRSLALLELNNDRYYQTAKTILPEDDDEYFNLYNQANAAITDLTSEPLQSIAKIQAFIDAPALFSVSVKSRLDMLAEQMDGLNGTLATLDDRASKTVYENNGGMIISAMCLAAANPLTGNFGNRLQVSYAMDLIYYWYNLYLSWLDSLQSNNNSTTSSFIPDHDPLNALASLVDFTIANLMTMSLSAKQERILYLEDDSNVILLTHRFYGLDSLDENISTFIENNSIGRSEMLSVRKGRAIRYYI